MAILKMTRFNLMVFEKYKKEILTAFQNFKEVDFVESNLEDYGYKNVVSAKLENIEEELYKLDQAIKKLRKYAKVKGGFQALKEGQKTFTYKELLDFIQNHECKTILKKVEELQIDFDKNMKLIENSKAKIQDYITLTKLDISKNEIMKLKQCTVKIGSIATKNLNDLNQDNIYYEIINETVKETILAIVFKNSDEDEAMETLRKVNFNSINIELNKTPSEYISDYKNTIDQANKELTKIEEQFTEYALDIETLEIFYEYYSNEKLREQKSEDFAKTNKLIYLEGYIPTEKEALFEKTIKKVCDKYYYLNMEEVKRDSNSAPIKLKNDKFSSAFEGLVKTYSMPSYNEVDPTPLVAPFYWLFFGMMVADFGYGLLVTILSFIVLKTCNLKESVKKNVKFFFYLGFSIMLWGAIYGSYFSLPLGIPGLINPTTDYNTILKISIIIGLIHVFVGLGTKAYIQIRDGKALDAFYDVGLWYITLTTVILLLLGSYMGFTPLVMKIIKYIMIIAMIGIILTGGRDVKNIGGRIGLGVYSLYGISGYMGDLISYARLMALGLSGGFIALSVNQICAMVGFKPATIIFVILIFIFGQTFNLSLSLLGAYVHSARLIYVEFFGKFYEGGGREFKDFKIDEKYINIKEDK